MPTERIVCNLCGNTALDVVESGEGPFKVYRCRQCSLVFVHPVPESAHLKAHYDEGYYEDWINRQHQRRIKMWKKRFAKIEALNLKGNLLDIGCGDGMFLQLAQEKGWNVFGTELSAYGAELAAGRLNQEIHNGELETARFPDALFDVVTIWHVLEHVRDPGRYLAEIRRILKPAGILLLAVPNVNDLVMKAAYRVIKGRKLKLFSQNDREIHLYHFSEKTIKKYLEKAGFKCRHLGPDLGYAQWSYKLVNFISIAVYLISGIPVYNSIEIFAV